MKLLLPELLENKVYVGQSAGSMVMSSYGTAIAAVNIKTSALYSA